MKGALLSLAIAALLASLGTSSANVALPTLALAFGASFQQVQWVVIAYLLAITVLIVVAGRLGDVVGRRRLLLAGLALFTLASFMCGFAPTLGLLIAARAAQGLGAAIMMALTLAIVGDTVSHEKMGSAMGLLGTMSAMGTALGPSLGGMLIAGFGWQAIFFVNVPVSLFAFGLAYRYLPRDQHAPATEPGRFDYAGTVLLALTLAAYSLAMTLGRGSFGLLNLSLLLISAVGIGVFVRIEQQAVSPLIRLALLRQPLLCAGLATSILVTTMVMATLVVGPFYLSGVLRLDTIGVGLVMSSGPIVATLTGIPAGRLVERFGTYRIAIAGLAVMAGGVTILPLLATRLGVQGYIAAIVAITAGYALFQAANNTAVMTRIRPTERGATAGMLSLSRNLGLITGASLMGSVFAVGAGVTDIAIAGPAANAAGMRATFAVAAVLIYVALAIAFISHHRARRGSESAGTQQPS